MKQITLLLIAALSIFLFACEGPEGPAGADGQDGNANVQSKTFTVYPQDWQDLDGLFGVSIETDLLTESVIKNGSVHLYFSIGEDAWVVLPYLDLGYGFSERNLALWSDYYEPYESITIFRLVAIDGYPLDSDIPVDFTNYKEVEEYFKLVD